MLRNGSSSRSSLQPSGFRNSSNFFLRDPVAWSIALSVRVQAVLRKVRDAAHVLASVGRSCMLSVSDLMPTQVQGVLVGTIAAIVLVPVIRFVWQRLAPGSSTVQLTPEARQWSARIGKEAVVSALACLGFWALGRGLATELDLLDVATAVGIILGAPLWWVLLRTKLRGAGALAEYASHVEANDGISFRSLCIVAVVATAVAVVCGLLSYVRSG